MQKFPDGFAWLNEPAEWSPAGSGVDLVTGLETDFWQTTFYGFQRDSGHAYLRAVSGDFTASASFTADYQHLYDQAGLMLRIDERRWIKTGIEYTDGLMHFSVVVTNGLSDWSVVPLHSAQPTDSVGVRLTRHDDAVRVQYSVNGSHWQMARLAPFSAADARVGVTACSPQREGLRVRFRDVEIGPPISRQLHAD